MAVTDTPFFTSNKQLKEITAFPDLPSNCIFNKVITGCGGTTIVLFNNENYVIAVPTTELITNKTGLTEAGTATITSPSGKEQRVFGLFGIFSYQVKKELKEYLATSGIKKIMCTYDKLPKLEEYLNPSEYRLLVMKVNLLFSLLLLLISYPASFFLLDSVSAHTILTSSLLRLQYCRIAAISVTELMKKKAS